MLNGHQVETKRSTNMASKTTIAVTGEDYITAKQLVVDYANYLNTDLSFQHFDKELERFNTMYGLPSGCIILAEYADKIVGTVGLRFLSDGVAEMKRMFVYPQYHGLGIGSALMLRFIDQAKALGYRSIKLDTIPELDKAIKLYEKHGFTPIKAYCYNPHPEARFYERKLY